MAQQIAESLVDEIGEVQAAECYLVSRIGAPIDQPQTVTVRLNTIDGHISRDIERRVNEIVATAIARRRSTVGALSGRRHPCVLAPLRRWIEKPPERLMAYSVRRSRPLKCSLRLASALRPTLQATDRTRQRMGRRSCRICHRGSSAKS